MRLRFLCLQTRLREDSPVPAAAVEGSPEGLAPLALPAQGRAPQSAESPRQPLWRRGFFGFGVGSSAQVRRTSSHSVSRLSGSVMRRWAFAPS